MLIIGVDVQDTGKLKNRVLDALGVDGKAPDRPRGDRGEFFRNPPFRRCVLYPVLAGWVDEGMVRKRLDDINNQISQLKHDEAYLNDVILIYYQGEDFVDPTTKKRYLKMSQNLQFSDKATDTMYAVSCHDLSQVPGSQLLLLNVARKPDGQGAGRDRDGDSNSRFMRYASNDPTEVRKGDPVLLALLQEAVRTNERLGDVIDSVTRSGEKQARVDPKPDLDPDQKNRRFGNPQR